MGQKRKASASELDNVSEDGILFSVISLLPIREAARTCILSKRWRYIWKYMPMPNLIFDAPSILGPDIMRQSHGWISLEQYTALLGESTELFIKYVDEVLKYQGGKGLVTFKILFPLDATYTCLLDRWLRLAIKANPKEIALHLSDQKIRLILRREEYEFPFHLFVGQCGSSLESLSLMCCSFKVPPSIGGFRSLRKIDLYLLSMSDKDLENLLSNCFLIELLTLRGCHELRNIKISRLLCCLKYLCVSNCDHVENMELCAPNLTSLEYRGKQISFLHGEASSLTKVFVYIIPCSRCPKVIDYALSGLSRDLPHVQSLRLDIHHLTRVDNQLYVAKFQHLKHLMVIQSGMGFSGDLQCLVALLTAAPHVKKFEVHLQGFFKHNDEVRSVVRLRRSPHDHLKEVEITGYVGCTCQLEFARFLLHNASALELMTLIRDEREYGVKNDQWEHWEVKETENRVRSRAGVRRYLRSKTSSSAKLVVI